MNPVQIRPAGDDGLKFMCPRGSRYPKINGIKPLVALASEDLGARRSAEHFTTLNGQQNATMVNDGFNDSCSSPVLNQPPSPTFSILCGSVLQGCHQLPKVGLSCSPAGLWKDWCGVSKVEA